MYTIHELAKKLRVCDKRIYNIARKRDWSVTILNKLKIYDIDDDEIEQFLREQKTAYSPARLDREKIMSKQLFDLQLLMDKALGKKLVYSEKAITMKPSKISLGWNSNEINKINHKIRSCYLTGARICTVADYKKVTNAIEDMLKQDIKLKSVDIYNSLIERGLLTFDRGEITRRTVNVRVSTIRDKILNLYPRPRSINPIQPTKAPDSNPHTPRTDIRP